MTEGRHVTRRASARSSQGSTPKQVGRAAASRTLWTSQTAIGFVVCIVVSVAMLGYLHETPAGPHRRLLTITVAVSLVVWSAGVAGSSWLASRSWRQWSLFGWVLVTGAMAAALASLDQGLDSPLTVVIGIPLVYSALLLGPRLVALCAAAAAAELAFVALTDRDVLLSKGALVLLAAIIASSAILALTFSVYRTRLQRAEETEFSEVERLARMDELTRCVNQRVFHELFDAELVLSLAAGRPLSLLVADVDEFKAFNDANGHADGDAALAAVGEALRSASRGTDVVGRIGGDEFAVLMPGASLQAAASVARRLADRFRAGIVPGLTLSIGVAELDPAEPTTARLFRDADAAVYAAKAAGRATVAVPGEDGVGRVVPARNEALVTREDWERATDQLRETIEQLRKAHRETQEVLGVLELLQSTAPLGFVFVDRDLRFVRVNQAAADLNQRTVEDHLGRKVPDVVPELWPEVAPYYRAVLERGETITNVEVVGRLGRGAGRPVAMLESFYPVRVDGTVIGAGVTFADGAGRPAAAAARAGGCPELAEVLGRAMELRDGATGAHQILVANVATAIAAELALPPEEVAGIEFAARVHEIGKIGLPDDVLLHTDDLTDAERALYESHATTGRDVLAGLDLPWPAADMVAQHHEQWDGRGYPAGLSGDAILLGARIVAVADALTGPSGGRAPGSAEALAALRAGSGTAFDPAVVDAALRLEAKHGLPAGAPAAA